MNLQSLAADHFGAAYRAAMAAISDADVRFRVEKLFYHAGNLVWHPDDDGTLGRESVVEELLAFASNSSALCDSLVRIVEHWPRKREWLATYWLASRVVGTLLVEGKLSPDHLTLAVRGMTETYLCSLNLDRTYPAKMYKLAWMFLDEMDPAFCVLRDSAQGPSMSSVVDLLICARQGSAYRGPYMDGEAELLGIDFATAGKRRREIVTAVESRLAELRRRGIEFAICWCAYGDEPRLDWSGDGDEDKLDVYQRLAEHPKELFDMPVE